MAPKLRRWVDNSLDWYHLSYLCKAKIPKSYPKVTYNFCFETSKMIIVRMNFKTKNHL